METKIIEIIEERRREGRKEGKDVEKSVGGRRGGRKSLRGGKRVKGVEEPLAGK